MRNAVAKVTEYLRKILKSGKSKMNKFPGAEKWLGTSISCFPSSHGRTSTPSVLATARHRLRIYMHFNILAFRKAKR